MQKLKALHEAMAGGLRRGALIHEKTGAAHPVEVLFAEDDRLLAVTHGDHAEHFGPDARVRIELPQETSVVFVPGRVAGVRTENGTAEIELHCQEGAEHRQRRMDVRVDADCRVRVATDGEWEETRTVNISAGGALLVSDLDAKVGDVVDLELDLEGFPIRGQAEVVRRGVKTHGIASRTSAALKFLRLPQEARDRIALFVLRTQATEKLRHKR